MLKKLLTDLRSKGNLAPIAADLTSSKLGHYYIDFNNSLGSLNKLIKGFDDDGIPINNAYVDVSDGKPHYYPISIGQVGLAIYHDYLRTGDANAKAHFLKIAQWFVKSRTEDQTLGTYWLTEVPKPEYQVYGPWKSAFTQSRALSILLRAWQETHETQYLAIATRALLSFTFDIADQGVAIRRKGEEVFYEEYVAAYPTRVLDGHFFSLFGLYDFIRAVPKDVDAEGADLAKRLFEDGVEGLIHALPKYDLGYWVRFNRCTVPGYPDFDPCTINYLQLVCTQLEILHRITPRKALAQYRDKFKNYVQWNNILKMYSMKFRALKNLNRL